MKFRDTEENTANNILHAALKRDRKNKREQSKWWESGWWHTSLSRFQDSNSYFLHFSHSQRARENNTLIYLNEVFDETHKRKTIIKHHYTVQKKFLLISNVFEYKTKKYNKCLKNKRGAESIPRFFCVSSVLDFFYEEIIYWPALFKLDQETWLYAGPIGITL